MKTIAFTVHLTFSGKISSDEEIKEIANNIAEALKREASEYGISPESSDEYVKEIEVSQSGISLTNVKIG